MAKITIGGSGYSFDSTDNTKPKTSRKVLPFFKALDVNGETSITIASGDAQTWGFTANFQEAPSSAGDLTRFNESDTAAIHIKSTNAGADSGKKIAGSYFPTP